MDGSIDPIEVDKKEEAFKEKQRKAVERKRKKKEDEDRMRRHLVRQGERKKWGFVGRWVPARRRSVSRSSLKCICLSGALDSHHEAIVSFSLFSLLSFSLCLFCFLFCFLLLTCFQMNTHAINHISSPANFSLPSCLVLAHTIHLSGCRCCFYSCKHRSETMHEMRASTTQSGPGSLFGLSGALKNS